MRSVLAALVLLGLTGSCVSGGYTVRTRYQEPPAHFGLRPGEADLTACLAVLGAPLVVREHNGGAVLAWGWSRHASWELSFTVPIDSESGSFRYRRGVDGLTGLVLIFDAGWTLRSIREGNLSDELPPAQRRAQVVEE